MGERMIRNDPSEVLAELALALATTHRDGPVYRFSVGPCDPADREVSGTAIRAGVERLKPRLAVTVAEVDS